MSQPMVIAAGLAWVVAALILAFVGPQSAAILRLIWYPALLIALVTPLALLMLILRLFEEVARLRDLSAREALERRMPQTLVRPAAAPSEPKLTPRVKEPQPMPAASPAGASAAPETQGSLALNDERPRTGKPLSTDDLLVAINFPSDENDVAGIRAMRVALQDAVHGALVLACQDVLTLLGQDGIYMDQSSASGVRPGHWRRFAEGIRGSDIAPLAQIASPDLVAHLKDRMRGDTIFRDSVQHFLRMFDRMLCDLIPSMSDGALNRLTETRSARAFMLLGTVVGAFGAV
jgi:hypothetical protein